jgi:hypothetical protein
MVVLPWEQPLPGDTAEGYTVYRWWPEAVQGKYLVVPWRTPSQSTASETRELLLALSPESSAEAWRCRHPEAVTTVELTVHHGPITGLFVAWESSEMPTLEQMGMFLPVEALRK